MRGAGGCCAGDDGGMRVFTVLMGCVAGYTVSPDAMLVDCAAAAQRGVMRKGRWRCWGRYTLLVCRWRSMSGRALVSERKVEKFVRLCVLHLHDVVHLIVLASRSDECKRPVKAVYRLPPQWRVSQTFVARRENCSSRERRDKTHQIPPRLLLVRLRL